MKRFCLIDVVGLTPRLIGEHTPCIRALAQLHGARPLRGVLPAVTLPAQATMLTGQMPSAHGIVGNGWLYRETMEIRFWQQARNLLHGETIYEEARRRARQRGKIFLGAHVFWWFGQGMAADWTLLPKPWYGCDGDKRFAIASTPPDLAAEAESALGPFPFFAFWGPTAGLAASKWLAEAGAWLMRMRKPDLTLIYLPHLDYDLQRRGVVANGVLAPGTVKALGEVDECVRILATAAEKIGAGIGVVSEYGLTDVSRPIYLNRRLRENGLLVVRNGPFGEMLDVFHSHAFAVADHQVAHIYVRDEGEYERVRRLLGKEPGVAEILDKNGQRSWGLAHERSGDLVALSERDAWFAYPYWLEEKHAPDFAATVDIHRKPGYDPCELFFAPGLAGGRSRLAWRLLQKRLGFRTRFDVIPLDAALVRGSHGLPPISDDDGPVFITTAHAPPRNMAMTDIKDYVLAALDLAD